MIERLNVPKNFVLSAVGEKCITVTNYGDLTQEQCFDIFADAVRNCPQQYERLFQLHRYFEPAERSDVLVVWRGHCDQYLLHASDMKAWATSQTLLPSEPQNHAIESLIRRPVSHVISL